MTASIGRDLGYKATIGQGPLDGIVNILGTSYSGADIKLIVHSAVNEIFEEQRQADLATIDANLDRLGEDWVSPATSRSPRDLDESEVDDLFEERELIANQIAPQAYVVLATAQTLSIQTFRETNPVRGLGSVAPRGFVKGPRVVAGSIIFTVFDEHALAPFLHQSPTQFSHELSDNSRGGIKSYIDQLPPLTISAIFANEYGSLSRLTIYGVQFVTDGMVMSIEDIFTENTCNYVAKDYDVLLRTGQVDFKKSSPGALAFGTGATSASSLLNDPEYLDYNNRLGVGRNPYK